MEMMRLENKSEETEEDSDESLTLAEKKMLPVVLTRIMSSGSEVKTDVPPLLLAWDAFVETLARFELAERVAYCNNVNVLLDDIMPRIFELLPQNPSSCVLLISEFFYCLSMIDAEVENDSD